jgi:translin
MKNLERIAKKIEKELNEKDKLRENAFKQSREIIRKTRRIIGDIHRGKNVEEQIKEAVISNIKLRRMLKDHPDLSAAGYVENASQELVEACCLFSIANDDELPAPDDLKVSPSSYLLGLADVVGELRREILGFLKKEEMEKAEEFFQKMEAITSTLMRFDYPSALVPIKKRQDVARALVERTSGEMLMVTTNRSLRKQIELLKKRMGKPAGSKGKKKEDEDEFGLDVDAVYDIG